MFKTLYVRSRTFLLIFAIISLNLSAFAAEMGVPVQLRLRKPDTTYLNETGVDITIAVLSKTSCILRIEKFSNQTVTDGAVSVTLGSGAIQITDPGLTLTQVYDNTTAKTNLNCVDANNSDISSGQTYTPVAGDGRIMRVVALVSGPETVIVDFNMKATPYAIQAESIGGKTVSDLIVKNSGTQLNQTNLDALLADNTRLANLLNLAVNGQAATAVSATNATNAVNAINATTATNFSGSLAGDISGTQSATVVGKIRGVNISATAPLLGQVLTYDGSQYIPTTPLAATVASVNGKTGVINLTAADIPGAITSSTSLSGDVTGNISATVVSSVGGKSAANVATTVNTVNSATSTVSNNTLVKRDGSGNTSVNTLSAVATSQQQVNVFNAGNSNYVNILAPNTFSNYSLTLPTTDGNNGEVLTTNGSGVLTWSSPGGVTSAAVISALGYTPANSATALTTSTSFSGDVTGNYNSIALANSGVAAGSYAKVTVDAKGRVTSGNALLSSDVTTALGYIPASATSLSNYVLKASIPTCSAGEYLTYNGTSYSCSTDQSGGSVTSAAVITALGYTPADTADSRISGALQQTAFNAYVASASCGVGQSMYWSSVSSTFLCQNVSLSGDASGNVSTVTVTKVQGTGVSFSSIAAGHILQYNGSNIVNVAIPTCSAGSYLTYNGSAWSCAVDQTAGGVTSAAVVAALGYTPANSATTLTTTSNFSGDVTGNYNSIVLANSGVAAGSYAKVTVDVKGRVTSGNALSASDVTTALGFTPANNAASGTYVQKSNNLSDLASATVARTNLGLGGSAILNVGTTAGTVMAGDDSRIAGALQQTAFNAYVTSASCGAGQSMYWSSVSSTFLCQNVSLSGDASGNVSTVTVTKVQNTGVSFSAIANGHILQYNGTNIVNRAIPTCGANQYLTFNGTAWSCAIDAGAGSGIVSAVAVTSPLQSTGGSTPTLSMPQATGSVSGYLTGTDWTTFNNKITSSTASITQVLGYAPVSMATLANYQSAATALTTSTSFSGDVSGNYNSIALANSGVAAGTYAKVTVDAKGRVTSGNALTSGDVTTALGFTPITTSLANGKILLGNGSNVASQVTMSGDATMTNAGVVALKNTGTAGTYGASNTAVTMTTDAQGRVTAVSTNPITITSSQVVDFATTVIGTVLPGFSAATATAVTAADSILAAIGKLQGQLNTLLNPATTSVSATGSITVATTTDTVMSGMTITPPAGTYQVYFNTTVTHGSNGGVISMSIYYGGTELSNSITQTTPRVSAGLSAAALTLNQTVMGEVTVNGSQAIEIRWNSSTGTATAPGARMMMIHRVR